VTAAFDRDAIDLADDARRLLQELDRDVPGAAGLTAECRPPVDVLETPTELDVVVDVPGIAPESLRVALRRNTLIVVGAKIAADAAPDTRYHLAERGYGRFARAIRLAGAFDATGARATVAAGELRVSLPRMDDRRGSLLIVPVERA
jgi:HSP20 family protein